MRTAFAEGVREAGMSISRKGLSPSLRRRRMLGDSRADARHQTPDLVEPELKG